MPIRAAWVGEDVPVQATYTDDSGTAIDPDDPDADGTPDATITIVDESDGTEVVSAAAMTHIATGEFEYVWDTSTASAATHRVEVEAEFDGNTDIEKDRIRLR